jgi:hypothetical protein
MATETGPDIVEKHSHRRGHTMIELHQRDDNTWVATQLDMDIEGTGETGALAAMEYCRKVAAKTDTNHSK